MRPYRIVIAREDPDQASQLRRSVKAVALHIAEADGRNQPARFNSTLGEARETLCNREVAVADRIVDGIDADTLDLIDRLVRLSGAARR